MELMHATCVEHRGRAVLLTGASGSGKSDLALRLIAEGAILVADDQVILWASEGSLFARAPDTIFGKLEVRGSGIRRLAARRFAQVRLLAELTPKGGVERLPEPEFVRIQGVCVQKCSILSRERSATAKIRSALRTRRMPDL